MTRINSILILLVAFLAVFCESAFSGPRRLLGAQIDLLPALVVYASLSADIVTLTLVCALGGLLFDSLSANPLGISVLPLSVPGFIIYSQRGLILRDQTFAQLSLGLGASALVPVLVVLMSLTVGQAPLLGWFSLWQWIVMSVGGAIATPVFFQLFALFDRGLNYRRTAETTSFRADREIRRGRN